MVSWDDIHRISVNKWSNLLPVSKICYDLYIPLFTLLAGGKYNKYFYNVDTLYIIYCQLPLSLIIELYCPPLTESGKSNFQKNWVIYQYRLILIWAFQCSGHNFHILNIYWVIEILKVDSHSCFQIHWEIHVSPNFPLTKKVYVHVFNRLWTYTIFVIVFCHNLF